MQLHELWKKPDPEKDIIDSALAALHRRASSKGDRQSIDGYAFDIIRSYNIDIGAKQLARLYREKYNVTEDEESVNEGYKLQLERDADMMVLHIVDTATGKRTEVRGKAGYETVGYDANDKLHQLLDKIGKTANVSELMNGETVTINPNHPQGASAKAATRVAFNEDFDNISDIDLKNALDTMAKNAVNGERLKDVFIMRHEHNMTFKQIGGEIGTGIDRARQVYLRSLRHLRKILQDYNKSITEATVTEALDNPYPVRWSIQDDDEWEGKAKTEAGDSIQIMITQGFNNHKWEVDFYVGGSMQVTGKGDQFRVFATVVSAVKKWWAWLSKSKQPVEAIIFSAFKGNKSAKGSTGRSSLYNRFANQFARSIGFTVSTVDRADNVKFVLTNPNYNSQQTENFADGKVSGKSRPGRVKRAGASCNGSVTELRKRAKNSSGEKAKMYHWCANMKSGKKK